MRWLCGDSEGRLEWTEQNASVGVRLNVVLTKRGRDGDGEGILEWVVT